MNGPHKLVTNQARATKTLSETPNRCNQPARQSRVRAKCQPNELSTPLLLEASETTQALTRSPRSVLIAEAHERIGNALNGLVAPLIGFAALLLGGFSRFGLWRQIMGAIFALIVVQMITRAGQGVVQGDATLWPLAYLGPIVGMAMALGLLFRASRPALLKPRFRRRAA